MTDPYERSRRNEALERSGASFALLTGNATKDLAEKVAARLGAKLTEGNVRKFADGEIGVDFNAKDVKGRHCYIIQSTCQPVNDHLMELYLMISACKRSGALSVSAICPYYGYARADRKFNNGACPISAAEVSRMLELAGVDKIFTVDLHSLQTQGFVSSKVQFDDFVGSFTGLSYFLENIKDKDQIVVVSPDAGGMKRATSFQKNFWQHGHENVGLAFCNKERKKANEVASMTLIGDVKDKTCILIDDMADTCGTLCTAADLLKEKGAKDIYAFISHGLFNGPAGDRIEKSSIKKVICTDSMPVKEEFKAKLGERFSQVSLDMLLAEIIRRTYLDQDTSDLLNVPIY